MSDFLKNKVVLQDMDEIFNARASWRAINDRSVYITGAAGMIASYITMFLIYLNEIRGFNISIFAGVRKPNKARQRFGNYIDKGYFHLVIGNAIDPIDRNVHASYIIHAASLASPQYYGEMPVEVMLPNVVGTYRLLEHARKTAAEGLLFLSSGEVYGAIGGVGVIDEKTIGCMDFLSSGNVYGVSKQCGEALCKAYSREYAVSAKSARIHHSYGPTMDVGSDERVFSDFIRRILCDSDIVLKSDGTAKRAFCYMTDVVSGLFAILIDGASGESYNLGNPNEYLEIKELAERLVSLFPEKHLKVLCAKRSTDNCISRPEQRASPFSTDKLERLHWAASVTVEEGFARCVRALSGDGF